MKQIVVTGIGPCLPGCSDRATMWRQLRSGDSQLSLQPDPSRPGQQLPMGRISEAQLAEQLADIRPSFVAKYHRATKLYLASLFAAWRDSGLVEYAVDADRIGLFDGTSRGDFQFWIERLSNGGGYSRQDLMFTTPGQAANIAASLFEIRGPSYTFTQSCAAGAVAIGHAYRELREGKLDIAYASGHDAALLAPIFELYREGGLLAPAQGDPRSVLRPYGGSRGNVFGEGAVTLVLETLEHARARGATILAAISGYAYGNNGVHPGNIDETGRRPAKVVRESLAIEGFETSEVSYVVGHGNGVRRSDQSELNYVEQLFGERMSEVPLISVKPIYGHAMGASSAASIAACVLIAHHGELVPTLNAPQRDERGLRHGPPGRAVDPAELGVCVSYGMGGHNTSVLIRSVEQGSARKQRGPRAKLRTLSEAISTFVEPGQHLHFASTPSRANAALLEVARQFIDRDPRFTLSATGFHSAAHILAALRLGARYRSCFYGDNYPTPRPNTLYQDLEREGYVLEQWSLATYVEALRAGALGHPYAVTRSLVGTDLGAGLAEHGHLIEDPEQGYALVRAWAPDIAFMHASAATPEGDVVACAPSCEGFWSAYSARVGVIATVERVLERGEISSLRDSIVIPAQRVLAVCVVPGGAKPQSHFSLPRFDTPGYPDDFVQYKKWRDIARSPLELARFIAEVLMADDVVAAHEAYMAATNRESTRWAKRQPETSQPGVRIAITGARVLAERIKSMGHETILAGIGHSFSAARLAVSALREQQIEIAAMVETGLLDIDVEGAADEFLLSHAHMRNARRLSAVEDVLGCLTGGPNNRTIGVFGAAEIDPSGNINSTRLNTGRLLVGSGGANDIAATAREVLVTVPWSRLVEKVAHVTSSGRSVQTIVTDRGVLSRERGEAWTLTEIWADETQVDLGVAGQELAASVPWSIKVSDDLRASAPPTPMELASLRSLQSARPN